MTVTLYNNSSAFNVVHKSITEIAPVTGTLRETTQVVTPIITIETSLENFINANYVRIPDFNRYYYIAQKSVINSKLFEIALKCDVLMTFWDAISQCDCIVSRNEYKRNNLLRDDQLFVTSDSLYSVIAFPNTPLEVASATDLRYVLILNGAGSESTSSTTTETSTTQVVDTE